VDAFLDSTLCYEVIVGNRSALLCLEEDVSTVKVFVNCTTAEKDLVQLTKTFTVENPALIKLAQKVSYSNEVICQDSSCSHSASCLFDVHIHKSFRQVPKLCDGAFPTLESSCW